MFRKKGREKERKKNFDLIGRPHGLVLPTGYLKILPGSQVPLLRGDHQSLGAARGQQRHPCPTYQDPGSCYFLPCP